MNIKFKAGIAAVFLFFSISASYSEPFELKLEDMNGIWASFSVYDWITMHPEEKTNFSLRDFSWGKSKTLVNTTMEFDLHFQPTPLYFDPGLGNFTIKDIKKINSTTISGVVYRYSDPDDVRSIWEIPMILHFIDSDTLWIESEYFETDGIIYGKNALWHKISGPSRIEPSLGVINDTRVRIRTKPNLHSDTWGFLNTGDKVTLVDKSDAKQIIGDHEDYWYKVDAEGYPDGWVFGEFIDQ